MLINLKTFLFLVLTSLAFILLLQFHDIKKEPKLNYYENDVDIDFNSTLIINFGRQLTNDTIKIAVTSCGTGDILTQTLTMIKSAIIFTKSRLHFIIVVDREDKALYYRKILEWPKNILRGNSFEIIDAIFPIVKSPEYWKTAFKKCASQRLFYPIVLPEYDSIIHVDGDVVFLSPVEHLWKFLSLMNSTQMIAMATEDMNPRTSWYKNYKHAPIPTEFSLNTGIIVMNLTRMRRANYFDELEPITKNFKDLIPWFVNDVLGVYLHNNPEKYMIFPCNYNYLTDHCKSGTQYCKLANTAGVAVLHGSRNTFFRNTEPAFRAVYRAFRDYQFNTDLVDNLLIPMKQNLAKTLNTKCGTKYPIFIGNVNNFIATNRKFNAK